MDGCMQIKIHAAIQRVFKCVYHFFCDCYHRIPDDCADQTYCLVRGFSSNHFGRGFSNDFFFDHFVGPVNSCCFDCENDFHGDASFSFGACECHYWPCPYHSSRDYLQTLTFERCKQAVFESLAANLVETASERSMSLATCYSFDSEPILYSIQNHCYCCYRANKHC